MRTRKATPVLSVSSALLSKTIRVLCVYMGLRFRREAGHVLEPTPAIIISGRSTARDCCDHPRSIANLTTIPPLFESNPGYAFTASDMGKLASSLPRRRHCVRGVDVWKGIGVHPRNGGRMGDVIGHEGV